MAYRLQQDEPVGDGLKRIAEEQIRAAVAGLGDATQAGAGVYAARKSLKRARALMNLLEPQLGPIYLVENRRLRDVARRFSDLRDTQVSLELLADFAKHYKRRSTLDPQRAALLARQKALEQSIDWRSESTAAIEILLGTQKRIEDWPLHGLAQASLDAEMLRAHKKSRRAWKRATKTRTAEDFHELRKAVKNEFNQIRLFDPGGEMAGDLKRLSALLGEHHNLAVLGVKVENASGRFRQLTRRQQRQYEEQVLVMGARLFEPVAASLLAPSNALL